MSVSGVDSLAGMTDGSSPFFVIPAVVVVLVGLLLVVGIVVFFARLSRRADDRTPIIRSMTTEAADSEAPPATA